MRREYELLAPGGSYETILAAYKAGADAVYVGGKSFGARAFADNLSGEELAQVIDYAHILGKKLYLTVNTLVKQEEFRELYNYLEPLYRTGLDAVIVQDYGVMSFVHRYFPGLSIHASTQMTLVNPQAFDILKECGVNRVVLPRELSMKEINRICHDSDMEIECFVHGALCYCYSGQCLMSSVIGGRSGNRGRCAQPCRLPFTAYKEKGKGILEQRDVYPISPKDLCTLERIPEFMEAGITSFKIEGRMKRAEYTAGVVRIYRQAIDDVLAGRKKTERERKADLHKLEVLFNRNGFTDGYLDRQNGGKDMISFYEKKQSSEAMREQQELYEKIKGLYVTDSASRISVSCSFEAKTLDAPMTLRLSVPERANASVVCTSAETVSEARKAPTGEEEIREKLLRFGNTMFEPIQKELSICVVKNAFVPMKAVNNLRQRACDELKMSILKEYRREELPAPEYVPGFTSAKRMDNPADRERNNPFRIRVATLEQWNCIADLLTRPDDAGNVEGVYVGDFIFREGESNDEVFSSVKALKESGRKVWLEMPMIFRERAEKIYDRYFPEWEKAGFDGYLIHSLEEMAYLKNHLTTDAEMVADYNVYCMNDYSYEWLRENGFDRVTYSFEQNKRELEDNHFDGEMICYGRIPLMVSAQCVNRLLEERCTGEDGENVCLIDRKQYRMPVVRNCRYCYNVIYNSQLLWLFEEESGEPLGKNVASNGCRISFTTESADECEEVFRQLVLHRNGTKMFSREGNVSLTKGHFKRGVE